MHGLARREPGAGPDVQHPHPRLESRTAKARRRYHEPLPRAMARSIRS